MSSRHPVRHPFAYVQTQGGEHPGLILAWLHGHPSAPDAWFAEVVINSPNTPGSAVQMLAHSKDVRRA